MNKAHLIYHYLMTKKRKFASREDLEKWQLKQFNKYKKKVLSKSQYYENCLHKELKDFPIIKKSIMMEEFNNINTAKLKKEDCFDVAIKAEEEREFKPLLNGYTVGLSSGTSGNRGLFIASDKERMVWAGIMLAKVLPESILKKQKVALFLRANSNLYESIKSSHISFQFYDLMRNMETLIKELEEQKPSILIAPSQVLLVLAKHKEKYNLNISPKKIISVAEVLEDNDKRYLEKIFNKQIDNIYQCTEGFLGVTCKYGTLHLNEDIVIIEKEWIDKESRRFVPIITDFRRESQPIVRYKLDDILKEKEGRCPCGSHFIGLEKVEGRCDDILIFDDNNKNEKMVFPDFIRNNIIIVDDTIKDYKVCQLDKNTLEISIDSPNKKLSEEKIKETLIQFFKKQNIIVPEFKFIEMDLNKIYIKKQRIKRVF